MEKKEPLPSISLGLELRLQLNVVSSNFRVKLDFTLSNSKQNARLRLPKENHPES